MRKKLLCIITAAILASTAMLSGCSEVQNSKDNGKLSIVTTCFPPYDFARQVAGDSADITMLLCPGAEAHSYEPTPLDIVKIRQCDVFIYIGGEGEVWVDKILSSMNTDDMTIIRLFDFAEPLEEEAVAGASPDGHSHNHSEEEDSHIGEAAESHNEADHEHDHDHEHSGGDYSGYDEHIWTSLSNAQHCIEGIAHSMSESFPQYAEKLEANADAYISELEALDEDFTEMVENAPENVIVIGDRFPFRYLTHDYGIEYFAAFSGCSSESEPGVYTMAFLINELKAHDIDTVFYLEFSTKRLAEKLSSAVGAEMLPLHSCNNISREDFKNGTTYAELMWQNLNNLREALY